MTAHSSVLGCVGLCRVGFFNSTQGAGLVLRGFAGVVLGVLGLCARARDAWVSDDHFRSLVFFLCEALKTQQTQHTQHNLFKAFVFIEVLVCWVCVGLALFVLGWVLEVLA